MEITNIKKIEKEILKQVSSKLEGALNTIVYNIITEELPKGYGSSISDKLYVEKIGEGHFQIIATSMVWSYLNWGTGIYNPEFAGSGVGGRIVAYKQKRIKKGKPEAGQFTFGFRGVLHFKNAEIASALGFKNENVFLKSVKGIKPRYFFERHLETSRFHEVLAKQ